jgi:hypothetical protein
MDGVYGNAIMDAYNRMKGSIQGLQKNQDKHKVFFLGGGRVIPFYETHVLKMAGAHVNSLYIPETVVKDVMEFLQYQRIRDLLKIKIGDHRLLISQMLAQPYDRIPELDGRSWRAGSTIIN